MKTFNVLAQTQRQFATTTRLANIKTLAGFNREGKFVQHHDCEVIIQSGKIKEFGKKISNEEYKNAKVVDTKGALVTPGFVDPHTHIFPPVDRANEFNMRVNKSYEEIAAAGGGIQSSVKACRKATVEELLQVNEKNVKRFIQLGTTTLEMKSGYGLDLETELKLLEVINSLKLKYKRYIDIVPTFLGAHSFPPEFKANHDGYVDLICDKMIPEIGSKKLAEFCDVFCEEGYFTKEQALRILQTGKKHKMKPRVHADEFKDSGAAAVAAKVGALSADHLMAVSEKGIERLAKKKVIATMLPGTTIFLGQSNFAPVRNMIEKGVEVAISTDYNPGSSVFNNQALMMTFAMQHGKMTLEEAFKGVTLNAAKSLRRKNVGLIDKDAQADLLVWNLKSLEQIPYYNSEAAQEITHFIKKGRVVPKEKIYKLK